VTAAPLAIKRAIFKKKNSLEVCVGLVGGLLCCVLLCCCGVTWCVWCLRQALWRVVLGHECEKKKKGKGRGFLVAIYPCMCRLVVCGHVNTLFPSEEIVAEFTRLFVFGVFAAATVITFDKYDI